jgi:hypothetical protein
MFTGSRLAEQLSLRSQQGIVAPIDDSVLRTEMASLESQEEDAPKRILHHKPTRLLGRSGLIVEMKSGLLVSVNILCHVHGRPDPGHC